MVTLAAALTVLVVLVVCVALLGPVGYPVAMLALLSTSVGGQAIIRRRRLR